MMGQSTVPTKEDVSVEVAFSNVLRPRSKEEVIVGGVFSMAEEDSSDDSELDRQDEDLDEEGKE